MSQPFGQHFLHDQNILRRIVSSIQPQSDDNMVEIGPGLGALTKNILPHVKKLTAIEIDQSLIPQLQETCEPLGNLTLLSQDVLTVDFTQFGDNLRVIGNLPYNISSPILFHLLPHIDKIKDMHFLLQKEVVDRIVSKPGNKVYGRLSVMLQYFCEATLLFKVSPNAFSPPPKVLSAVLRLIPKRPNTLPPVNLKALEFIVKQAFSQRRKMLRNTLHPYITSEQLLSIDINPTTRAEQLSLADFSRLCMMFESLGS
jgi:16S rRNA (adenine1518-N6/adenine1519-N6)-dimethyltransferase